MSCSETELEPRNLVTSAQAGPHGNCLSSYTGHKTQFRACCEPSFWPEQTLVDLRYLPLCFFVTCSANMDEECNKECLLSISMGCKYRLHYRRPACYHGHDSGSKSRDLNFRYLLLRSGKSYTT